MMVPMEETSFIDKLAQLRATSCQDMPTPELAVLTRTTARLRRCGILNKCLQSGETAPNFSLVNAEGEAARFYDLLDRGPVVLNFFRGFWCAFCKTEFEAYANIQQELDRLGCHYLAISPQKTAAEQEQAKNWQIIFDKDNEIAEQFGIVYSLEEDEINLFTSWGLRIDQVNDTGKWELPLAATFIVTRERTIGYEFVDVDFRARCCPDELIEEIKSFC
jgi:peroxiredoxin|tara:strand:+ start:190 stop:846 length:657 start_codon:yes stop_codon:yes gene_type:complete